MARFGQFTKLTATAGNAEVLERKFREAAVIQQDNPACELMVAGRSREETETVYLIEIWASEAEWEHARTSAPIAAWAAGMAGLVAAPPESTVFIPGDGKGLPG